MNDFFHMIQKRISLRDYDPDRLVPDDELKMILEAGRLAPSAQNRQPWEFYLAESPGALERIKQSYTKPWFQDAPLVLALVGDTETVWRRQYDGYHSLETDLTIAMDHIILGATALGVGTCWIANFQPDVLRSALELSPSQEVYAITPLGYPKGGHWPEASLKKRKPYSEIIRRI
jgi:nitroreductase